MNETSKLFKEMAEKELAGQLDTSIMERIADHVAELKKDVVELQRVNDLEESLWDE